MTVEIGEGYSLATDSTGRVTGIENPRGLISNTIASFNSLADVPAGFDGPATLIPCTSAELTIFRQNILATTDAAHPIGTRYKLTDGLLAGKIVEWNGEAFSTTGAVLTLINKTGINGIAIRSSLNPVAWSSGLAAVILGSKVYYGANLYLVGNLNGSVGALALTGNEPVHTSGTVANGAANLTWISTVKPTVVLWVSGAAATAGDVIYNGNNAYTVVATGNLTATAPVHASGTTNGLTYYGASDTGSVQLEAVTIPGFLMGKKSTLRLTTLFTYGNSATTKVLHVIASSVVGGQTLMQLTVSTTTNSKGLIEFQNSDDFTLQKTTNTQTYVSSANAITTSIQNTLADFDILFKAQWGAQISGDAITLLSYKIELIP